MTKREIERIDEPLNSLDVKVFGRVYTKAADAAKPETLITAIDEVKAEIGTPDVFVYHVGNITFDPEDITNELLMEHYQVDVASAYVCGDHLGKDEDFAPL